MICSFFLRQTYAQQSVAAAQLYDRIRGKTAKLSLKFAAIIRSCLTVGAGLALSSSPAAAQQRASAITERDRQTGAQEHQQILAEFGGAYTGPGAAFVSRVARTVAVQSGLANTGSDCTVTLLDSTVANAFALPGCYVYVTRGLLAIANDEAEVASVLGHEIGHVAARHSQKRQTRSTLSGLGSVLASVFLGQGAGQIVNYVGQRQVLAFSRDQEYQADELGIRYIAGAGYDPFASPDMLRSLQEDADLQTQLQGKAKADMVPAWARTHPLTADRIARAAREAQQTGVAPASRPRGAGAYYAAVDGMLYGDNPREGVIDDELFTHPGLKLRFQAPTGAQITNGRDSVTIATPDGGSAQFAGTAIQRGQRLEDVANQVAQKILGQANAQMGQPNATRINGLDAVVIGARAQTKDGVRAVTVAVYRWTEADAFYFVTIAPPGRETAFDGLIGSLRRITEAEAAAVKPRVVEVVTVRAGDTALSLSQRMAFRRLKLERFLALNDLAPNRALRPGDQVKLIVTGR